MGRRLSKIKCRGNVVHIQVVSASAVITRHIMKERPAYLLTVFASCTHPAERRSSAMNATDRHRGGGGESRDICGRHLANTIERSGESRDRLTHLLSPTSPPAHFHVVTSPVSMATGDAGEQQQQQHLSRFDADASGSGSGVGASCRSSMSKSASASSLTLPAPHRQYQQLASLICRPHRRHAVNRCGRRGGVVAINLYPVTLCGPREL